MMSVPLPSNENDRLAQLIWFQILDTPPEESFDRISRTVARIVDAPIALVSLVDRDRQWFKSSCGLAVSETARDQSFCSHTISQRSPLIVGNALEDDRFKHNPLVVGDPKIRAYAGVPLMTEDGFALGSLCAIDTRPRDFTDDQMAALKDLADTVMDLMRYRLLHSDIRQSTDTFSAQVSHEIRTPLNAIIGFSEALRSGLYHQNPARAGEYLEMISDSGRDLDRTLGRLLDEARGTTGFSTCLEPVTPHQVVQQLLPMLHGAALPLGVTIDNALCPAASVTADEQLLRRILMKLTTNAIDYNVEGGTVRIEGEETPNGWYRIRVADTGIGIPAKIHDQLFDRVSTSGHPSSLARVKLLADKIGGHIGFSSRPGHGSDFWIDLPCAGERVGSAPDGLYADDALSTG